MMNDETVKVTLDVPKVLRHNIRIAAAAHDRTVAAELRAALGEKYGIAPALPAPDAGGIGSAEGPQMQCGEV